jgi:hypothetical protein
MPRYEIWLCDVICEYRFNRAVSYITIEDVVMHKRPDNLKIERNINRVLRRATTKKKEQDRYTPVRVVYKSYHGLSNDINE